MREHLEYQRFEVWHCSLPACPPTCLSSNLCISTNLTPTLTHSQAFVLVLPLPNHLSLTSPPTSCMHLFPTPLHQAAGVEWLFTPPPRSYHSLSLFFPFSLSPLSFCVCVSLSMAAGRRREDAITAARGRVGEKKARGKHLQSPQGCQLHSPQPLALFNQANGGNCCGRKTSGSQFR